MSLIRWAIRNPVPINLLMVMIILLGISSAGRIERELFPKFQLDQVVVTVEMEGGSTPDQVDRNIVQVIQPRIQSIDGIKEILSQSSERVATLRVEVESGYDPDAVKDDIKSEIDTIRTLPDDALDPRITVLKHFERAINIAVYGRHVDPLTLRRAADAIKREIKALGVASRAELYAAQDMEVAIRIPRETLQAKDLSIEDIARVIQDYNIELTAGVIRTDAQNILIKGEGRKTNPRELGEIPVRFENGEFILLKDLAGPDGIYDGFTEDEIRTEYNGFPAVIIQVEKGEHEDLVDLCDRVKAYIAAKEMPPGIQIQEFRDLSLLVNERLQLILKNGAMGLLLVLLTLALFLEWRIAFWVASGIAFSIIGAVALLYAVGGTINMLTLFGFLMTTGIIVDDAIVVGENFFNHKEDGGTGEEIAERSMKEIGGPVLAMVNTTLVAFLPLFFVTGLMGEFIRIIPSVVLCALVLSLFESLFILPSHLAHHSGREPSGFLAVVQFCFFPFIWISRRAQPIVNRGLNSIASGLLLPFLRFCLQHRYAVSIFFLSLLILLFGMIPAGIIKTSLFPRPDTEFHQARIEFERGTPIDVTARAARLVREAYIAAGLELEAKGDVNPTEEQFVEVGREGAHVASVQVKLKSIEEGRSITGQDFVDLWRSKIPDIPNLLSLQYTAQAGGPPSVPVEIWLTSAYNDELLEAEQATLDYLSQIEGTVDVRSDNIPGALTLEVTLKPGFRNSPSAEAEIIRTLANNYQGIKVDTFYRGDNEVKMWVRSALRDRRSLAELRQTQLPSGLRIDQIAQLNLTREEAEIRRVDGERTITISSDIDRSRGANAAEIRSKMEQDWLWQIAQRYPTVRWQHSGESKEGGEAIDSMLQAYIPALFAIYLILATVFRSYTQPLIIMFAIPFAFVGAVVGHFVMDIPVNLLSLFGIVGLTGIAVNDSLVLIDCINSEREKNGKQLLDALQTASRRRLRPILLTSLTTIAGMSPILFETSFQAQFLIPMVTSIVFGIGAATILILVLIPVCYAILADILEIAATFSPRGRKS